MSSARARSRDTQAFSLAMHSPSPIFITRVLIFFNSFSFSFLTKGNDAAFCFSDVTQPVRSIFVQNDSRPCPSLHGHHSTSRTMPQGKIKYRQDAPRTRAITCFKTKSERARPSEKLFCSSKVTNASSQKCATAVIVNHIAHRESRSVRAECLLLYLQTYPCVPALTCSSSLSIL